MEREFVSFEVAGDLAHFRRQYAITTALTYPIPPRTALCGLVGALLGLPKNEGLTKLGDDQAVFGLQLLNSYRVDQVSINLLQTKGHLLAWRTAENPHTAMRYELIRDPRYRVLFSHAELGPQLFAAIAAGEAHYTPCLGLAWMLAWLDDEPERLRAIQVRTREEEARSFFSPIRTDSLIGEVEWDDKAIYQRVRMPAEMQPDRQVTRYQEYVIETTGRPIRARLDNFWELDDRTAFSAL